MRLDEPDARRPDELRLLRTPDAQLEPSDGGHARRKLVRGELRRLREADRAERRRHTIADEADVAIAVDLTDVRNNPSGTDYTGSVLASTAVTVTDKRADAQENPALGTTQAFELGIPVPCTATGSTSIGSSCTVSTTVDSLIPGAVVESARSNWELGQFASRTPARTAPAMGPAARPHAATGTRARSCARACSFRKRAYHEARGARRSGAPMFIPG